MKQKFLLFAGCALLLLPSTLPAKSPKGQHPDHVEPKNLVEQAKRELQKEIQTLRQEVGKVRKELDVVRQQTARVHTACFLQDSKAVIEDKSNIIFPIQAVPESEIAYDNGIFTLPHDGVYMIIYGVTTSSAHHGGNHFELQLSGNPVVGGRLFITNYNSANWTGSITTQITAKAGQQLHILNVTGSNVLLGSDKKDTTAAYISILQLH